MNINKHRLDCFSTISSVAGPLLSSGKSFFTSVYLRSFDKGSLLFSFFSSVFGATAQTCCWAVLGSVRLSFSLACFLKWERNLSNYRLSRSHSFIFRLAGWLVGLNRLLIIWFQQNEMSMIWLFTHLAASQLDVFSSSKLIWRTKIQDCLFSLSKMDGIRLT